MTTIEDRAKAVTDEVGTATTGAELRALIEKALRGLVEECAAIADELEYKEGFRYWQAVASDIADRIRALANPPAAENGLAQERGDQEIGRAEAESGRF